MQTIFAKEWFTPETAPAYRYLIRGLSGLEFLEVAELLGKHAGAKQLKGLLAGQGQLPSEAMERLLRYGVVDWDGVKETDGSPAKFTPDRVREISWEHMAELSGVITPRSILAENQEKN